MTIPPSLSTAHLLPAWVPNSVRWYIDHTQNGISLRNLARREGCHASTILRQVRRFENRRDDLLIDEALEMIGAALWSNESATQDKGPISMTANEKATEIIDEKTLEKEARRVLRRLCEPMAVLVLAADMDKAAVMRIDDADAPTRTAVVEREIAHAFVLKDWVTCARAGRVATYKITSAGRSAMKRFLAEDENLKRARMGFSENVTPFAAQHIEWEDRDMKSSKTGRYERVRQNLCESPLTMLGRRRDKNGRPFLDVELVQAGERFREDFELAQMGPRVAQNWERFLTPAGRGCLRQDGNIGRGPVAARDRVMSALEDLGPGLGDIIMRCCCFLEGLEAAEKRMGWSARSGKVVLKIALQRLRRHYLEKHGLQSAMIG